ncbi:MAG: serine protease [Maricaulaceae bacterium]
MWSRFFRRLTGTPAPQPTPQIQVVPPQTPKSHADMVPLSPIVETDSRDTSGEVRRHFFNEPRFQCYASFFAHWDGWVTAGHCMTDAQDHIPPFASGALIKWPDGLDAAVIGCRLPAAPPRAPKLGEAVVAEGYPAGARTLEQRRGKVYFQRSPGTWIMHIETPDEPVVTGMSGGRVRSLDTGEVLGIIITRNSPADLDKDRDPDESCDFIALNDVWHAVKGAPMV